MANKPLEWEKLIKYEKRYEKSLGYSNVFFWRKGGGKTQEGVIQAYYAHKRGETVISNVWLDFDHIRFQKTKDLVPILYEIANYCWSEKLPIEAPAKMLKEYWLERKKWTVRKFFLLFDEIGNHLNARNWQKNFKDEVLVDMLTEPRKYNLTIVGITQSTKSVDIAFLRSCEDWFLFWSSWKWIFERYTCHHFWVLNWEFDINSPEHWKINSNTLLGSYKKFAYFDKMIKFHRGLYYTWEIIWAGIRNNIPHLFKPWDIYSPPDVPVSAPPFLLKQPVPEQWAEATAEANMGGVGGSPTTTKNLFPLFTAHVESQMVWIERDQKTESAGSSSAENGKSSRKNKTKTKRKVP